MKLLLVLLTLVSGSVVGSLAGASVQLDAACESKLILQMPQHQWSSFTLDFSVEDVRESSQWTIAKLVGGFSDAGEDYSYQETHEVFLKKGTCDIERVEFLEQQEW